MLPGPDLIFVIRNAAALVAWLRRPGLVRGLEPTTGLCMVGPGVRTAVES
jgi:threonine/homoserine/homoserine lactone efflux protein